MNEILIFRYFVNRITYLCFQRINAMCHHAEAVSILNHFLSIMSYSFVDVTRHPLFLMLQVYVWTEFHLQSQVAWSGLLSKLYFWLHLIMEEVFIEGVVILTHARLHPVFVSFSGQIISKYVI
jgi:hypothetical protein